MNKQITHWITPKKLLTLVAPFLVGFFVATVLSKFNQRNDQELHALEAEWDQITKEFYVHYLVEQEHPKDLAFLSDESKLILHLYQDQFRWDAQEQTLHLSFAQPVKISTGLLSKAEIFGSILTPDTVEQNAKLFKEAGILMN